MFKRKEDKIFGLSALAVTILFIYLLTLSLWWFLLIPGAILIAAFIQALGQPKEEGLVLSTRLVTAGGQLLPCKLIIRPEELYVKAHGLPSMLIPVNQLAACLVDDRGETSGFTVEYDFGQLIFFETGLFCGSRARKRANLISEMQANWYKGTSIERVGIVNVGEQAVIECDQLVHHPNLPSTAESAT